MFASKEEFLSCLRDLPLSSIEFEDYALSRQNQLTKPSGALGRLEEISVWLSGWQANKRLKLDLIEGIVFAANHGVVEENISAYPAEVTSQMVANFMAGGAAINALSKQFGHKLTIRPIALERPTQNFTREAAMSEAETLEAINIGVSLVAESSADLLYFGEMGIGNTTTASVLAAAVLGGTGADWAGPGTGLDADAVGHKAQVIDKALQLHQDDVTNAFEAQRLLGGRELAAIMGGVIAARQRRIPVVLDGYVVCSAVMPLILHGVDTLDHCMVGHCSGEPGHRRMLDELWWEPLLHLNMRLGEGTGAALAAELVKGAVATYNHMATFEEAAVASKKE